MEPLARGGAMARSGWPYLALCRSFKQKTIGVDVMKRTIAIGGLGLVLALILTVVPASAQHVNEHKVHHPRSHLALFVGNTQLEGHSRFTLGADFEYRLPVLHDRIGVGALAEAVFGEHRATILGGAIFVHPVGNVKVLLAPSVEFSEGHKEFLFRSGLGYDLHLGQVSVTPSASLDYVSGHVVQVYGVSLGMSF